MMRIQWTVGLNISFDHKRKILIRENTDGTELILDRFMPSFS